MEDCLAELKRKLAEGGRAGNAGGDDDFGAVAGLQGLSVVKAWNQVAIKEHALRERTADRTLARAVPWIRAQGDRPFFAFVHFYDVHGPYDPHGKLGPAPTDGAPLDLPFYWPARDRAVTDVAWLEAAYDQEVAYVDGAVGQVLDALGPELDHTLLIVTADHECSGAALIGGAVVFFALLGHILWQLRQSRAEVQAD
jgi:hypothetical protein